MTDDTRKVQLGTAVDTTGAKTGFQQVKEAARDMAREVVQQGQAASKGVDGIGAGGQEAAGKVDRATRSIIGSIQRTTAAMQAGERGSAAYFETLARQRGISVETLRPYLQDLQRAQEAQKAASAGLDNMGMSARATAAALRGVPAQFTDIFTSLASGQQPLTVLLQQGGQLKDMFGGAGAAARALGGYVVGLVNPFTVAAAAAIGIGAAFLSGASEAGKLQRALIESGNAAGTTAGQLAAAANEINRLGQGTTGKAVEVLAALAATGRVGAENMQRFAVAAMAMEKAGGQAAAKTVEAFAELGKSPLQGALKLNEAINFLTVGTYRQIKALEDQGRTVEAARLAQETYAAVVEQRAPQIEASLGIVERAWNRVKKVSSEAIDYILKVGREDTTERALERVSTQIEAQQQRLARYRENGQDGLAASAEKGLQRLRQEQTLLQERLRLDQRDVEAGAQRVRQLRAAQEWDKEAERNLSKREQLEREIARIEQIGLAAGKSRVEIERLILAARQKYAEKSTGTAGDAFAAERDTAKEWAKYYQDFKSAIGEADAKTAGLTKSQAKLVEYLQSPAYSKMADPAREYVLQQAYAAIAAEQTAESIKASAKAAAEAATSYERYIDSLERSASAVAGQLQSMKDEAEAEKIVATGRLTLKAAIEEVTIARMQERREQMLLAGDNAAAAAIEREIQLRAQLRDAIQAKEVQQANEKAAKDFTAEWGRQVQDLSKALTDALLDGGKDGIQRLQDWLRNVVLRVPVQAAMQSVAGSVLGAFGLQSPAQAGGAGSSLGSAVGVASSIFGAGGLTGALSAGMGWMTGAASFGHIMGAAGSLIGTGTAGGIASGLGMGLGAVAPYALAALAVYNLFLKDKNAKLGYGSSAVDASGNITQAGRLFDFGRGTDQGSQSSLVDVSKAVLQGIALQASAFGGSAAGINVQAATDIDRKGLGAGTIQIVLNGQRLGGVQTGGTDPLSVAATKIDANALGEWFSQNTNQAIIAGLQASDLPKKFADYFDSLMPESMTAEQATAALELASAVQQLGATFGSMTGALGQLDEISVSAAESLFKLFGGAQQFSSTVSAYVQAFYSETERAAMSRQQIAAALQPVGLSAPATREQFRALVDAQDLTTESGRTAYAALMQVSAAFAELTQSTGAASESISAEIERLRGMAASPVSPADASAKFAIATAAARAGDAAAMASLPTLSQAVEEAARGTVSSAADLARVRAWLANSLQQTLGGSGGSASPTVTTPTPVDGGASALSAAGSQEVVQQLQALNERMGLLEEATRATALHGHTTARLLQRAAQDGDALTVRIAE